MNSIAKRFGKRMILTFLMTGIVFMMGLSPGLSNNELRYWYNSSQMTIVSEWLFILTYSLIGKFPWILLRQLWHQHKEATLLSSLWALVVIASFFHSSYYGVENPLAHTRVVETISHFLFFVFLWDWLSNETVDLRPLFGAFILSAMLIMLVTAQEALFIHHLTHWNLRDLLSLDGIAVNTNVRRVGYQMETALLVLLPLLLFSSRRIFWFLISLPLLWLLYRLGGRASFLGLGFAFLFLGFVTGWRKVLKWLIVFFLLVLLFYLFHRYTGFFNTGNLSGRLIQTLHSTTFDAMSSGRVEVWRLLLAEWARHPLLGTGPQSYYFYISRPIEVIHAHNFLLQFLGEWGLLGSALFLYLLFKGWLTGWQRLRKDHSLPGQPNYSRLVAGTVIIGLSATGLFGGTWFFPQTSFYLAFAFALWLA